MDGSRKFDLAEVTQARTQARSTAEREYLDHLLYRLINESTQVSSLRHELIAATRAGDLAKVKRVQAHINYVRAEETSGKSWGNDRSNRKY